MVLPRGGLIMAATVATATVVVASTTPLVVVSAAVSVSSLLALFGVSFASAEVLVVASVVHLGRLWVVVCG